ncbi:MAG TPA: GNAT family N-acetyltransferase [Anaerolineae bacterium]|nr:GNAT family N-acetyltransferase [Anaerolineae bacterium]
MSEPTPINNTDQKRYQITVGDHLALLEYMPAGGGNLVFTHTEVPEELEGQGIGSRLVRFALDDAQARNIKIIPMCPFVAGYIKRHPEYRSLVYGYKPQ